MTTGICKTALISHRKISDKCAKDFRHQGTNAHRTHPTCTLSSIKFEICIYAHLPFLNGHTRFVAGIALRVFSWGRVHRVSKRPEK